MNVLVAVASEHGSTRGIADAIADELRAQGLTVEVHDVTAVASLRGYDAVVIGSAIHGGKWLPEAEQLVAHHTAALRELPVWLFSSGLFSTGIDKRSWATSAPDVGDLEAATNCRDHHIFAGRLESSEIGFVERLALRTLHLPMGDYRDWDEIRAWARAIGAALSAEIRTVSPTVASGGRT